MREQELHVAVRSPRERRDGSGRVPLHPATRGAIRDSRDEQPPAATSHQMVGVDERAEAETLDLTHPPLPIPVVLVVPPDEALAVGRGERRERRPIVSN